MSGYGTNIMNRENLKIILDLYKDDKINIDIAMNLIEEGFKKDTQYQYIPYPYIWKIDQPSLPYYSTTITCKL